MKLLIGLGIAGSVVRATRFTPRASLGESTWGPSALLRDLELRLGLAPVDESASTRLPRWTARIESLGDGGAFCGPSFSVDKLGTAEALLDWRDALVEAGWDGAPIANGGERLAALSAIELHDREGMPLGRADRLARVERALEPVRSRIYESIALLDDASLWPTRLRRIFQRLEALGTSFSRFEPMLPGALPDSDLGVLQARLRGERGPCSVRGDGSLLFLSGDTPGDLAELTAALLASKRATAGAGRDLVVRCTDPAPLEAALGRYAMPAQGLSGQSAWRPAMQVLPLAIELAFEPRDPHRVLELLTLPLGPFRGGFGARLARAVTRQPGIGGKEWTRQKTEAAKRLHDDVVRAEQANGGSEAEAERAARAAVDARSKRVAEWLEGPTADPRGIERSHLLAVVERVRVWLKHRLRGGEVDVYGAAYAQTAALAEAVTHDTREVFSREEAHQLVDRFARSEQAHALSVEAAGRVAHVDHPAAILAPCSRVFLWGFVSGTTRKPARTPWNDDERAALEAAGVSFPDPSALLRAESAAWRRAVLAARERIVFVIPRTIKGTATAPHPLWDEVSARLTLDESALARLTIDARRILDGRSSEAGRGLVRTEACAPLALPAGRDAWQVPRGVLRASAAGRSTSVTSLEKIATCPLSWVLEQRAGLRSGAMSKVATGALLNGHLGHRLVEELHSEGAFELAEDAFLARAAERFEALLRLEGAALLLPGASIERAQLTRQIRQAMRALYRYLARSGYRIAGVEETVTTESAIGPLEGRLDLRLADREGRTAILDLKWGASTYRTLLGEGRAVQLAAYVRALAEGGGDTAGAPSQARTDAPAAYFALAKGQLLSTDPRMSPERLIDGPPLATTWRRVEATARAVVERLDRGIAHVSGTKRSLPLLDALGVAEADRDKHFEAAANAACGHCDFDALCGRKWEAFA